jgi:small subunit ribosomal protein S2
MTEEKEDTLLIPRDQYLAAGIHIGTQIRTMDMEPFIYRITRAGLYVIDIRKTDERMRVAARFISRFDPQKIIVVSARRYGHNPIQQFAYLIGANAIPGRFVPGTLTNPNARSFMECDLLVITDPRADRQALREAKIAKIPVVSFCDTDNSVSNVDLCVPANNRGRKALALIFWLLTRSILLERGEIAKAEDFTINTISFQSRGRVSIDMSSDRQKIMEKIGEQTESEKVEEGESEEGKEVEEEAPEEADVAPESTRDEEPATPEEPAKEEPAEPKPEIRGEKTEPETISPVGSADGLIKGPLPEEAPKEEESKSDESSKEE